MSSIIVTNFDNKISKEDLRVCFKDCGEIKKIILNKVNPKNYEAIIAFEDIKSISLVTLHILK